MPDSPDQTVEHVMAWLEQQSSWLIVIDNLDDINVIDGFLPVNSNRKHTLITTRNPSAENIPAQGLEVDLMSSSEASMFFLIRAGFRSDSQSHADEAGKIAKELGYLPLAIEQAAAYIRESKRKIEEYLPLYQASQINRQRLYQTVPQGPRTYQYSIATTWNISITRIEAEPNHGRIASDLLRLCAFLNPDGIRVEFLQRGSSGIEHELKDLLKDDLQLDGALQLLQRFSLIKFISEPRSITIHRMVQEVIQHNMNDDTLSSWWDLVMKIFLSAFPDEEDYRNRSECRKYQDQTLPSLLRLHAAVTSPSVDQALYRLGSFLQHDGKYVEAGVIQEAGFQVSTAVWGVKAPRTLITMANLAATYRQLGRYEDAMSLGERALEARKEILGESHPDTLSAMANLAETYWQLGCYEDAMGLEKRVLEASKEILGESHPDTLRAMANLAVTYRQLGHYEDAMGLEERVLEARKEILGENHPLMLRTMGNLALTLMGLGEGEEAICLARKATEGFEAVLGKEHPDSLQCRKNLEGMMRDLDISEEKMDN